MILLLACAPHAVVPLPRYPARVEVVTIRRDVVTVAGEQCLWEVEQLRVDDRPLWPADPPDDELWCRAGVETARVVDILGHDGPFLSTLLSDLGADGVWTRRCLTWDIRTGTPATLDAWDNRMAPLLWAAATRRLFADTGTGWTTTREGFVVRGGHVAFCAIRAGDVREIVVR